MPSGVWVRIPPSPPRTSIWRWKLTISEAKTVKNYLDELPEDRREAIVAVRDVIIANLSDGYEERMNWGYICYEVPLSRYPDTYNGQPLMYAGLASHKNYMAVYLNNIYADTELCEWFTSRYIATGKRLDMGKSCIRFRKLENLPLEVIGEAVAQTSVGEFIDFAEKARDAAAKRRAKKAK